MSNIMRHLGMVVILLAVVLAAALVQPEWARDLRLQQCIETARAYGVIWLEVPSQGPAPQSRALDRRAFAKERIIVKLLDGRLTLFEAAAQFRCLNAEDPVVPPLPDCAGDTEEEQLCWQVISYVEAHLHLSKGDYSEATARLKEELRRHKEQHGKILLPEVAKKKEASDVITAQALRFEGCRKNEQSFWTLSY
jgi:hypothetical protein